MPDPTKSAPSGPMLTRESALKLAVICSVVIAVLGLLGFYVADVVDGFGLGSPHHISSNNIFYYLFYEYERWACVYVVILSAIALIYFRRRGQSAPTPNLSQPDRRLVTLIAVMAGLIAAIGTYTVCLNHPLAMDEYLTNFQAKIFLHGKVFASLGTPWNNFGAAMTPTLAIWDPTRGTWTANYLPVYAAIRTPFLALGAETILKPLLTL